MRGFVAQAALSRFSRGFTLDRRGFTLIEICIVMVIASLALTAGVNVLKQYRAQQVIKTNNERIETIKKAMAGYIGKHNRAPCAAARNLPPTNINYGKAADCAVAAVAPATVTVPGGVNPLRTVRIGAVPVRDLGLSNAYIADAHGNLLTYAVTEVQTVAPLNPNAGGIDIVRDPLSPPGVSEVEPAGSAIYTVISSGKDGKGAWTAEGLAPTVACPAVPLTNDDWNCQPAVARFVSAPFSTATGIAQHFDDQVAYTNTVNTLELPICGANEVLNSEDGVNFRCALLPGNLADCQDWQRLISNDGTNFTCQDTPYPPVACGANEYLRATPDGRRFECESPDYPATVILDPPLNCGPGQVLSGTGGTNYRCQNIVMASAVETICKAYPNPSTWYNDWSCRADCPAGTVVTGGGYHASNISTFKGRNVFRDRGHNGYYCSFNLDGHDCADGSSAYTNGCGLQCSATCSDTQ